MLFAFFSLKLCSSLIETGCYFVSEWCNVSVIPTSFSVLTVNVSFLYTFIRGVSEYTTSNGKMKSLVFLPTNP